jgi:hypothetical protein
MTIIEQGTFFDYAALDAEARIVVQQRTGEIKTLMRRAAQDIIDIGQKLIEVKAMLGHGRFGPWLKAEFDWSEPTAQRFMRVCGAFQKRQIDGFAPSALYLLAAPSTPEAAREEAIRLSAIGERITHQKAKDIIEEARSSKDEYEEEEEAAEPQAALDDEPEDEEGSRYCKYCYTSHDNWDYTGNNRWVCGECNHGSYDAPPSGTEEDEEDDEPLDAYEEAIAAQHQAKQAEPEPEPPPATENHQRINLSTNNEWYTPGVFLEAVRQVLGQIDLDPASCAFANQVVQATRYYTQEDDGLHQPWFGKVWMNPPYGREEGERDSNQARWTRRLLDAYHAGDVTEAIMLVNAVPGNRWFVPLKDYPICFPDGRIRFYNEATEAGQPTHSNAFVYLGPNIATFDRVFSSFGAVMCRASVWAAWQQEQANA